MTITIRHAAIPFMLGAVLACGESGADVRAETSDVIEEAAEAGDAMKDWLAMSRDEFTEEVAEQKQELQATIDDLKQRAEAASEAGKSHVDEAMSELESGWTHLQAQSEELADASAKAWDVARRDFVAAMDDVKDAAQRVRDELSRDGSKTS